MVATYLAMRPEENKTWEFGYKGILADRVYLDATYFRSDFENFMSPLTIVGNPFATAAAGGPTFAKPLVNPGDNIPVNAQGRIVNQAATPLTPRRASTSARRPGSPAQAPSRKRWRSDGASASASP